MRKEKKTTSHSLSFSRLYLNQNLVAKKNHMKEKRSHGYDVSLPILNTLNCEQQNDIHHLYLRANSNKNHITEKCNS